YRYNVSCLQENRIYFSRRLVRASCGRVLLVRTAGKRTTEVWKPFVDCFKRKDESCAQVLQDSCKHSEHRMVKILRIDVKSVGSMLETNPRLKMVLLFRDPRGSMNSRLTTAFYQKYVRNISQISNNADMLCSRMRADMSAGKKLKIKYPGRVILIQYEDLDDSENKLNKLYDFLNIEPPKQRTVTVVKMVNMSMINLQGFILLATDMKCHFM
ncbi:hypothetical protein MAR_030743, partial [Mya arenaria]